MARDDDDKRNFALRGETGNETSVFSGRTPRQAALKAARRGVRPEKTLVSLPVSPRSAKLRLSSSSRAMVCSPP